MKKILVLVITLNLFVPLTFAFCDISLPMSQYQTCQQQERYQREQLNYQRQMVEIQQQQLQQQKQMMDWAHQQEVRRQTNQFAPLRYY